MTELRSFDRVAHVYDETRGLSPDVERPVVDGIHAALVKADPSPTVLEVGVGTGRMAVPLAARGVRVTGLDISTQMMARLHEKDANIPLVLAEAAQAPFAADVFDGALFVHILHLVPDVESTVREALRVVRPGGVIVESRDDTHGGRRADLDRIVRETVLDLSGVDVDGERTYDRDAFLVEGLLRDAGAEIATSQLASWSNKATGREFLDRLKRRDYSRTWKIPDEVFDDVVERMTLMIEDHLGGLDVEFEVPRSVSMLYGVLP